MGAGEGRIARGGRLAEEAFSITTSNRRLLVFPAIALLVDLIVVGVLLAVARSVGGHHRDVAMLVALSAAFYPLTVCSTFFNVALMHVVSQRWRGNAVGLRDGLGLARQRIGAILAWSVLAATVGLVLQVAQRVGHFAWIERVLAVILNVGWGVATFFVVPALALEDIGPLTAIKRSSSTVRRRWAEGLTGTVAIGGVVALLIIPGLIVCVIGGVTFGSDPGSGIVVLLVGAALTLPVALYVSATSAVFSLAVWEYAADGAPRGPFSADDLDRPFIGGAGVAKARNWIKTRVFRRAS